MKFKFKKYGEYARAGTININGRELETPHLFPVMCFYCGGLEGAKFGGGIYRNIKEEFLPRKDFSNIFQGVMTSISHLADFHVTKKKLENIYLAKTIHEWFDFDGVLFVDSGGFKLFKNGAIKCTDFEIKPDPKEILNLQEKFGGDIIATLDYPIHPELPKKKRKKGSSLVLKMAYMP
jgi:queuine/archaeosine tRNA-ribosyltransferase